MVKDLNNTLLNSQNDVNICNLHHKVNVPKSGPILSQSENAFQVRYHTGNDTVHQVGKGYYLDLENKVGGLSEINTVLDNHKPLYTPKKDLSRHPIPNYLIKQDGGAYNYITNPLTNRKVNIHGKIGKKVLENFLKNII